MRRCGRFGVRACWAGSDRAGAPSGAARSTRSRAGTCRPARRRASSAPPRSARLGSWPNGRSPSRPGRPHAVRPSTSARTPSGKCRRWRGLEVPCRLHRAGLARCGKAGGATPNRPAASAPRPRQATGAPGGRPLGPASAAARHSRGTTARSGGPILEQGRRVRRLALGGRSLDTRGRAGLRCHASPGLARCAPIGSAVWCRATRAPDGPAWTTDAG